MLARRVGGSWAPVGAARAARARAVAASRYRTIPGKGIEGVRPIIGRLLAVGSRRRGFGAHRRAKILSYRKAIIIAGSRSQEDLRPWPAPPLLAPSLRRPHGATTSR